MKKSQPTTPAPDTRPDTALAEQLRAKGFNASAPAPTTPAKTGEIDLSKSGKIVIRRERKGRGGKTVTLVQWPERPPNDLPRIAQAMRKELGCGSTVEDGAIVLLGDLGQRAHRWLEAHGATRLVMAN